MFSVKIKAPAVTAGQKPVLFFGRRARRNNAAPARPENVPAFREKIKPAQSCAGLA